MKSLLALIFVLAATIILSTVTHADQGTEQELITQLKARVDRINISAMAADKAHRQPPQYDVDLLAWITPKLQSNDQPPYADPAFRRELILRLKERDAKYRIAQDTEASLGCRECAERLRIAEERLRLAKLDAENADRNARIAADDAPRIRRLNNARRDRGDLGDDYAGDDDYGRGRRGGRLNGRTPLEIRNQLLGHNDPFNNGSIFGQPNFGNQFGGPVNPMAAWQQQQHLQQMEMERQMMQAQLSGLGLGMNNGSTLPGMYLARGPQIGGQRPPGTLPIQGGGGGWPGQIIGGGGWNGNGGGGAQWGAQRPPAYLPIGQGAGQGYLGAQVGGWNMPNYNNNQYAQYTVGTPFRTLPPICVAPCPH